MQCYTILYSQEGYFLIFEKREEGFFFHDAVGTGGFIYPPNGIPIKNGGGLFAFPGGAVNQEEEPFKSCLREYTEECGNSISFNYYPLNQPQSLATLSSMSINGETYTILLGLLETIPDKYYTLYLEMSLDDLRQIQAIIVSTNFNQASQARENIHYNKIKNYTQIFEAYPFCPLDDELGQVQLWQALREVNEIRLLSKNKATDWYYDMIVYLANTILNLGIPF
ncbi:hypothetical protein SY27_07085 [Flavobacterium sp. 316]|uniref:hypothetical protein n=1 Tax=Flavobacterium sp. 316 TaxID=1603293 RepID=UPI0005DE7C88|nr:hypothetical protein [Flavobacterium sp. 316]KIX21467.1 hypothetical protein SY27_07085 [Flavobacterium sp. 316]